MKSFIQLVRQPGKTIAGILLMMLAVAALCICVGQYVSANATMEAMDYQFNSVALQTRAYDILVEDGTDQTYRLQDSVNDSLDQIFAQHSELIKLDSRPGLASAYIAELTSDLYVQHQDYRFYGSVNDSDVRSMIPLPYGAPYTCAMLETTIVSIEPMIGFDIDDSGQIIEVVSGTCVKGIIDQVHTLHSGYQDPTGFYVNLCFTGKTEADLLSQGVETGSRYLVYGKDYFDWDWTLREAIRWESDGEIDIDAFSPENITYYSEERVGTGLKRYVAEYKVGGETIYLAQHEVDHFRCVELTEPEVIRMEGDAEAFWQTEAGAVWQQYLRDAQVNNHAFPIIGVDRLGYIANFAQGIARIVQGRDFTQAELDSGAKVCILSESLAVANGLSIGDTICPLYYGFTQETDRQHRIMKGYGTTEPTAYFYGKDTSFCGNPEEYTIVGLYRAPEWDDPGENLYYFTPNTIFAPKNSVSGPMDYSDQAFFRTIVLENGKIQEFMQLMSDAGLDGLFICYDQGYSQIHDAYQDFLSAARGAALIGTMVFCIVLVLFCMLFPGRQDKTMKIMERLGAAQSDKLRHIVVSSMGILIPGTVIGMGVGLFLWDKVSALLLRSSKVMIEISLDAGSSLWIGIAQFMLAASVSYAIAFCVSKKSYALTET